MSGGRGRVLILEAAAKPTTARPTDQRPAPRCLCIWRAGQYPFWRFIHSGFYTKQHPLNVLRCRFKTALNTPILGAVWRAASLCYVSWDRF